MAEFRPSNNNSSLDSFIKLLRYELNNLNIDLVKDILNDETDDKLPKSLGFQGKI